MQYLNTISVSKGRQQEHHHQDHETAADSKDQKDLQAIQNHSILIALGGVARSNASSLFPVSVT